jgi:hypothetical protein
VEALRTVSEDLIGRHLSRNTHVPIWVSGVSLTTAITEDIYQHVTPGVMSDATSRVANLFSAR